jgi:hypothetical protein
MTGLFLQGKINFANLKKGRKLASESYPDKEVSDSIITGFFLFQQTHPLFILNIVRYQRNIPYV